MRTQSIASASVTLDASGSGTLVFGPRKYSERWKITRLTTNGDSGTDPNLQVYRGAVGTQMVDTTDRANKAVSETNLDLSSGEFISCRYSGGVVGSIMTFYVEGEISYGV